MAAAGTGLPKQEKKEIASPNMSRKDDKGQLLDKQPGEGGDSASGPGKAKAAQSKEERLAEALRANLRRRKTAAKSRKAD